VLALQMKLVATDVTFVVLKNTGHWVMEERPKETMDALQKFLFPASGCARYADTQG
jgi:pimeloyl-ACP methyl ester carboxylesterase